jgi:YD repeat-containing protein
MKKAILLFTLLLGAIMVSAQVTFGYDAAGNRISRTIVLANSLAKTATTDSIPPATEMLGEMQVKVYPNPTKGQLSVEINGLPDDTGGTIRIYTLQGQLILEQPVSYSRTSLNIGGQPVGTYVMKITAGEKNTTWKIIKQ